jgi:serine-type D-Ala-D-Ala carboxypeptidase/endopeptidase
VSRLEKVVHGVLDRRARKHVGIAVGVRHGGESAFVGRGRVGDDRPRRPDERTIFEIGSITKAFTATLLADLAREGVVALDDPVQRHLPDGVVIPVRGRPITLADLASHTSGLPRLPKGFLRIALRERANPYASYTAAQPHAAIAATKPRREPGRKLRYSNYGAGLLGHVLELRTGQSYEQLVAERITGPLGLTDTAIAVTAEKLGRFAQGHDRSGRATPYWDRPALAGAGALRSTVADLLRFLDAQTGDAPPGLAEAMRETQKPRATRNALSVGLGWFTLPIKELDRRVVWYDGGTGGFRSVAGFVDGGGTAVVVLSNSARAVDRIGLDIARKLSTVAGAVRRSE